MRTIGWIAAAGLALAAAGAANAGDEKAKEADYSAAYKACMDKSSGADFELAACNNDETDRQDKALNQVYRDLTAKADPKYKPQILKVERAWMAYRDAQCDLLYAPEAQATDGRLIYSGCMLEMTHDRVQALRRMADDVAFQP
jgi:uncharacterized protein YecT (DUF1311 family)